MLKFGVRNSICTLCQFYLNKIKLLIIYYHISITIHILTKQPNIKSKQMLKLVMINIAQKYCCTSYAT